MDDPPVCSICNCLFSTQIHYPRIPHLITFDVSSMPLDFEISNKIKIMGNSRNTLLTLKGILYFGDNHFTMQMFELVGKVWFHDGQRNTGKIVDNTFAGSNSNCFNLCDGKRALVAIYCH